MVRFALAFGLLIIGCLGAFLLMAHDLNFKIGLHSGGSEGGAGGGGGGGPAAQMNRFYEPVGGIGGFGPSPSASPSGGLHEENYRTGSEGGISAPRVTVSPMATPTLIYQQPSFSQPVPAAAPHMPAGSTQLYPETSATSSEETLKPKPSPTVIPWPTPARPSPSPGVSPFPTPT